MLHHCRADAEDLNSQNEAELRRQVEERQQETEHVYELLGNKIQLLQEVRGGAVCAERAVCAGRAVCAVRVVYVQ